MMLLSAVHLLQHLFLKMRTENPVWRFAVEEGSECPSFCRKPPLEPHNWLLEGLLWGDSKGG